MHDNEFLMIDDYFDEDAFMEYALSHTESLEVVNSEDPKAGKIVWNEKIGALYKDGKMV